MRNPGETIPNIEDAAAQASTRPRQWPVPRRRPDPSQRAYLLLRLSLLDVIPSHLDARGEDPSGEISHIDTQQVGHFLGS